MSVLDALRAPWAIAPERLLEIQAIYRAHLHGEKADLEAIEARLGRVLANEQKACEVRAGGVAVLPVEGILAPRMNLFTRISGGASTYMLKEQIDSLAADSQVRGLILACDTPGGAVQGIAELAESIYRLAQAKPVVTWAHGQLCSAGLWLGAAANAVYLSGPAVQAGSIGVVYTHHYEPGAGQTEIVAGRYKRIASPLQPLSDEGREWLQADVDYVYSLFVEDVARFRGVSASEVLARMADARVFRGQQAIDCGLADGLCPLDELAARMAASVPMYT